MQNQSSDIYNAIYELIMTYTEGATRDKLALEYLRLLKREYGIIRAILHCEKWLSDKKQNDN